VARGSVSAKLDLQIFWSERTLISQTMWSWRRQLLLLRKWWR